MPLDRKSLPPMPDRAPAVLAELAAAGPGVGLSVRLFSGDKQKTLALAWLCRRGWARRFRSRVSGQLTYVATPGGRRELVDRFLRGLDQPTDAATDWRALVDKLSPFGKAGAR